MRYTFLSIAMVLTACQAGSTPTAPPETTTGTTEVGHGPRFVEGITLSTSPLLLDHGVTSTSFNFDEVTDLWVRVSIPGTMSRHTVVKLEFIDPTGQVFYELLSPFKPDTTPAHNMDLPGMGLPRSHDITVAPHKRLEGGAALDSLVAVTGTNFTRYRRPGTWKVVATLTPSGRTYSLPFDVSFEN